MVLLGKVDVIERSGNDLIDYPVLLEINDAWFFERCNDQAYIEILDEDKTTILPFYVEVFDVTNHYARIWVKIPSLPANSTKTIYINVNTNRTTPLSNPNEVFDYFDDGTKVNDWTISGNAGESDTEGLPPPSYFAESVKGDYMYINAVNPNEVLPAMLITFNVKTNVLGNLYFLCDVSGAGQAYRIDTRAGYTCGLLKTTDWETWSFAGGNYTAESDVWYKFAIIVSDSKATLLYEKTTDKSPIPPSNEIGTFDIEINGGYVGLVGDNYGAGYYTWWDNIIIRKFVDPEPLTKVDIGFVTTINVKDVENNEIPIAYFVYNRTYELAVVPYDLVTKKSTNVSVFVPSYAPVTIYLNEPVSDVEVTIKPVMFETINTIRKVMTNRMKIEDTKLIVYEDDQITPFLIFELLGKDGKPNAVAIYEKRPIE